MFSIFDDSLFHILCQPVLMAHSDASLTGDQEVAGLIPVESGTILL